jgi:hypothetical protein
MGTLVEVFIMPKPLMETPVEVFITPKPLMVTPVEVFISPKPLNLLKIDVYDGINSEIESLQLKLSEFLLFAIDTLACG